jgi:hypothetical protein
LIEDFYRDVLDWKLRDKKYNLLKCPETGQLTIKIKKCCTKILNNLTVKEVFSTSLFREEHRPSVSLWKCRVSPSLPKTSQR